MPLRAFDSYPPQEPFSPAGARYHEELRALNNGIDGDCFVYGGDPYQALAVFPAAAPNGTVLAFLHGGGWTNGYKEWMAFMAPPLNAAGVTFVSIGYRLAPQSLWPAGREDVAAGLQWIYANIADQGGDPARLFIGGHSAGGHYAAWLAVRGDWQAAAGLPGNIIRGALPVSGVYDFTPGNGMTARPRFLGGDAANDRDASPLHVIKQTPPFLIAWGDNDFPHLIPQAGQMAAALRAAGGDVTTRVLQGCDHLQASYECGRADGQWAPAALDWMSAH